MSWIKGGFGQHPTYPEQWTEIFKTYQSDKYQEIEVEMKYLVLLILKPEGNQLLLTQWVKGL